MLNPLHRTNIYVCFGVKIDRIAPYTSYGVASGKCGFTTLRKFRIKKPNFSAKQNRESELFSYFIIFI